MTSSLVKGTSMEVPIIFSTIHLWDFYGPLAYSRLQILSSSFHGGSQQGMRFWGVADRDAIQVTLVWKMFHTEVFPRGSLVPPTYPREISQDLRFLGWIKHVMKSSRGNDFIPSQSVVFGSWSTLVDRQINSKWNSVAVISGTQVSRVWGGHMLSLEIIKRVFPYAAYSGK